MWRFYSVRDEDQLWCKEVCFLLDTTTFSTVQLSVQFSCLCSFMRGLLQSWYSVARWGDSFHPTVVLQGQFFDHVMDFHYRRQFWCTWCHRTRCSCMSIICRGLCFVARSDSVIWVLHIVMCTMMLHYELCARSGTTGDMMTYVIWWLGSFQFWRSVVQTQTFIGRSSFR